MKIKILSAVILSFALAQNSVASPVLNLLGEVATQAMPHIVEYQRTQSPEHQRMRILTLRLDAHDLAGVAQYDEALAKLDEAAALSQSLDGDEGVDADTHRDLRIDLLERKTRHLIENQQIDEAKQTSQQSDEIGKQYALSNESNARNYYNIAHEMNQTAYAFADEAQDAEFAQAKRANIQATFDAIFAQYPELKDGFAYNHACLAAQRGDTKGAIALLNVAIKQHPYTRKDIDQDRDFDKVRQQPEFKAWLNKTFPKQKSRGKKKK